MSKKSKRKENLSYIFKNIGSKSIVIDGVRYKKSKTDGNDDVRVYENEIDYYWLTQKYSNDWDRDYHIDKLIKYLEIIK